MTLCAKSSNGGSKMDNDFEELRTKIEQSAKDKGLSHGKNVDKQFIKFMEEVIAFKSEIDIWQLYKSFKHDENIEQDFSIEEVERWKNIKLEIGNVFIELIVLCNQLGIDCVECLKIACSKIEKEQ